MSLENNEHKNNHHEISFQLHIDALREQKISWNTFVKLMEEFFFLDMDRLKYLNALILTELTISYSDMERSRYLNAILMKELKNLIEKENVSETTENVDSNDSSSIDHDLNDQTIKEETSNDSEIDMSSLKENALASSNIDIPNCIQGNPNTKTFICFICDKDFPLAFHLKQHMKKVHGNNDLIKMQDVLLSQKREEIFGNKSKLKKNKNEQKDYEEKKNYNFHHNTIHNDQKIVPNTNATSNPNINHLNTNFHKIHKHYKCKSCGKSFSCIGYLEKHNHAVHEGHKDYKCESCGKSFSEKGTLKKHIYTIHEGHKDYKCELCDSSFTQGSHLKKHLNSIHK